MKFFQTRLTSARAKNALSGETSQSAKNSRRSVSALTGRAGPSSGRGASGTLSRGWLISPVRAG